MKWLRSLVIFDRGGVASSPDWEKIHESYVRSIESIDFPKGKGFLKLRRKTKKPDGKYKRNGVGYLKQRFLDHLIKVEHWRAEGGFKIEKSEIQTVVSLYPSLESYREPITSMFGDFDFVTTTPSGLHVAIEWETGNISSSHRSMNKLAIALETGEIQVGVLIVPSRDLYDHLTDRIGNIKELSGYLIMWQKLGLHVHKGLLVISVVEHDELTD
ncbi:MAG: hypothetical protein ABSA86_13635, partial [Oryzomonas sp.]